MKREKLSKLFVMKLPPSLFEQFKNKCSKNYKTMSDLLRDYMIEYVKEEEDK